MDAKCAVTSPVVAWCIPLTSEWQAQESYDQRRRSLPLQDRLDLEEQLASLKASRGDLKSVEGTVRGFFGDYGDALSILALPKVS